METPQENKEAESSASNQPQMDPVLVAATEKWTTMDKAEKEKILAIVRRQPGRPTPAQMIKNVMEEQGVNRAKAKLMIEDYDTFWAIRYVAQQTMNKAAEILAPQNLRPLNRKMLRIFGYNAY